MEEQTLQPEKEQKKSSKNKFVIIFFIIVLLLIIGILLYQYWWLPKPSVSLQETGCIISGGTVSIESCCKDINDFFNTCVVRENPCGCSAEDSHQVKICNCGDDKCFDGNKCTLRPVF